MTSRPCGHSDCAPDDPWCAALATATTALPAPITTASASRPACRRCDRNPATTHCRICHRPLCSDCRIDHYHEGWES